MTELVTDKKILEKMEPSMDLLKIILQFKHIMNDAVIVEAKRIVRVVVEEISEKIKSDVQKSLLGKLNRNLPSSVKSIRNLNMKRTIKQNLKNYDKQMKKQPPQYKRCVWKRRCWLTAVGPLKLGRICL